MAIAYDNQVSADAGNASTGSATFTIAAGGSLWVFIAADSAALPTSVKWNTTESLTQILAFTTGYLGGGGGSLWYLANPTSGSHAVTTAFAASHFHSINAISLTGTAASPLGASASSNSGTPGTSGSVAITTTAVNSFIIDGSSFNHNFTITATGANQTKRSSQFVVTDNFTDVMSTIPATSIGSYTVSYSSSSSTDFFLIAVEVLAAVAAPTIIPRRALMGVGI